MKPTKLKKKYGKLTVITEYTADSRRYAVCKCKCGETKDIAASSLMAGRSKSCGRGACRGTGAQKPDPAFVPRKPRLYTAREAQAMWTRYHHPDPAKRRTMAQLGTQYGVTREAVTHLFRTVRKCGGISRYRELLATP